MSYRDIRTGGKVEGQVHRIKSNGVVFVGVDDFEAYVGVDADGLHPIELEGVDGRFFGCDFRGCRWGGV
jgi:hypothetical protein